MESPIDNCLKDKLLIIGDIINYLHFPRPQESWPEYSPSIDVKAILI